MEYKIFKDAVKIIDSCNISKDHFDECLDQIISEHPECPISSRKRWHLKFEWAVHNVCYMLGIMRSRTKDVDLNFTQPWYISLSYTLVGWFAMLICK